MIPMNSSDFVKQSWTYRKFVIRPWPDGNIGFNASLDIKNGISITLCADTKAEMYNKIDDTQERMRTLHIGYYCPKDTQKVLVFSPLTGGFTTELMVMRPGGIEDVCTEFYDVTSIIITSKVHEKRSRKNKSHTPERSQLHRMERDLVQEICVGWYSERVYE